MDGDPLAQRHRGRKQFEQGHWHRVGPQRPGLEASAQPALDSYLQCLQFLVKVSVNFCSFLRFMPGAQ